MATAILARDKWNVPIQALGLGTSQDLAFTTGASVTTLALAKDCQAVRLVADQDCRVAIGPFASVTAATTSARLSGGIPEVFRVPIEQSIGASIAIAVRGVTSSGTLNVVEMI